MLSTPSPIFSVILLLSALPAIAADDPSFSERTHDALPAGLLSGHLPPASPLVVRTASGPKELSAAVFHAASGPADSVAFVDASGLHLWRGGRVVRIADAAPRGLAATSAGVAFCSIAARGLGTGISFMSWDGEVRALIAPPEDLVGPAGFHKPSVSPDGAFVIAFSDLTPRPSLWRVDVKTGGLRQLASRAPGAVGTPAWRGTQLVWSTGDGEASLDPTTGELR